MIVIEERKICRMLEGLFQFDKECEWNDAIEEAMHRFVNLPTIEAVPVIRCKECVHYKGHWYCETWNNSPGFPAVTEDGFCNMAERRADETDRC